MNTSTKLQVVNRPVSEAKLRANRQNAQKSTGPRTKAGKGRSAKNAIKHSLLSSDLVVPGESEKEYRALYSALEQDWQPTETTEQILVSIMAECLWRSRRAQRCEKGEILRFKRHEERRESASQGLA